MKSAMQELKDNSLFTEGEEYIQIVLKKTEWSELLEKEKEQIVEANRQSRCNDCPFMYSNEDAEQYYNEKYNQINGIEVDPIKSQVTTTGVWTPKTN